MDLNAAQAGVIGSLLVAPTLAGEIFPRVRAEDFSDTALRTLFAALRELWLEQKAIDPVILLDRVGAAYTETVEAAMKATPSSAAWADYCEIVRSQAQLRGLQAAALRILESGSAEDARRALRDAEGLIADRESARIHSYREMAQDFLARMDNKKDPDYLDFGFPQLNAQLSISQGRFVVLAAESSVGKTALALQLGLGIARRGKRVGFFSLETSAPDAMDRIVAQTADVPLPAIKHKRIGDDYARAITGELEKSYELPFELIEAAGSSVADLRALTLAQRYEVIFVDYVQLLQAEGESPAQQVRAISMDLHRMSQQLGVTVIGLSQVTPPPKDAKGRRAELSKENLRESHQLIHDAEAILILDLTDLKDYGSPRVLKVDKNKDGPCCRMLLRFDARHMRFVYQPPVRDPEDIAAAERAAVKDRNREERNEKNTQKRRERDAQESAFREMEGGEEGLPF